MCVSMYSLPEQSQVLRAPGPNGKAVRQIMKLNSNN